MAETIKETVVIDELGKWGPRINGTYYSFSKNFTDKAAVVPGAKLEIETYVAESGKKYVNKILKVVETHGLRPIPLSQFFAENAGKPVNQTVSSSSAPVFKSRDFDAEARGKSKFGFFAAALQSPCMQALVDPADIIALAIKLSDAGMDYVFGESK